MEIILDKILLEIMSKRNLSLKKIATECGIPQSVLHGWINGTLPSAKNLHLIFKLAQYLELSIEELLFGQKITKLHPFKTLHSTSFEDDGIQYMMVVKKVLS